MVLGDHGEGETPDPIPNSEVKPFSADDTALVTLWESRTLPGTLIYSGAKSPCFKTPSAQKAVGVFNFSNTNLASNSIP